MKKSNVEEIVTQVIFIALILATVFGLAYATISLVLSIVVGNVCSGLGSDDYFTYGLRGYCVVDGQPSRYRQVLTTALEAGEG